MNASKENLTSRELGRFSITTLLAFTACFALLVVLWKWAMTFPNPGLDHVVVFLLPWTIGVFLGIARSLHRNRSPFWGAFIGGCVGATFFPILPGLYLLVRGMNAVSVSTVAPQILTAIVCSFAMGLVFCGVQRACNACSTFMNA